MDHRILIPKDVHKQKQSFPVFVLSKQKKKSKPPLEASFWKQSKSGFGKETPSKIPPAPMHAALKE